MVEENLLSTKDNYQLQWNWEMFKRTAQEHFPCLKTEEEIKASFTEMQMIRALVKNFPRDLKSLEFG